MGSAQAGKRDSVLMAPQTVRWWAGIAVSERIDIGG